MPTPNIIRSRSPVAVSVSCLPNAEEQSQAAPSRLQELLDANTIDLTKYASLVEDDRNAHADVDPSLSADATRLPPPLSSHLPADLMETDSDSQTTLSSSDSDSDRDDLSRASTRSPANSAPLADKQHATAPSSSEHSTEPARPAPEEWEFAPRRQQPKITSSLFRPFSRFTGTQKSDRQVYNVSVELKYVDMAESFCCGYLTIDGLTATLPSITTYFEGEIIGTKYAFQTNHPTWGASERTDLQHWSRFPDFVPLKSAVKAHRHHDPDFANRPQIFMRWKEQFLVPDHRKTDLEGASFEGFYYIMFDQQNASISGIYFHSKSEKFQRLELQHEQEEQCYCPPKIEFR